MIMNFILGMLNFFYRDVKKVTANQKTFVQTILLNFVATINLSFLPRMSKPPDWILCQLRTLPQL
jgi:hypothetical protein